MVYVRVLEREQQIVAATTRVLRVTGIAGLTMRAVAAEAEISLGTLHYVFPSKDQLLRSVIDSVITELATVLRDDVDLDKGVAHALQQATSSFWSRLVETDVRGQIMQYELTTYSLRSEKTMARTQYANYISVVSELYERAASAAGEECAIEFSELARLSVAATDGLVLQYLADPDHDRAIRDLERVAAMLAALADPRPTHPRR
ncbi:AcrR family transcriptional regulator [Nocardioides ginsengisegetis]|uniref:AcrR family transcriptional regulator n=1 Tax=Nocardioides ginsengisegetis TaxID=661491 RepID=A0A7W3J232_9ACTN|nr:AcrR family transcriptional regulator [Nocardioides ginsengisegetis]